MARGLSEVANEYGSRLVWGHKRIWLAAQLRLQPNMSCCNMARGLSEVVTDHGLRAVWGCNRIHPAAICISLFCIAHFCTSLTLKWQYHGKIWKMLWNDMHEVPSWIWSLFGIAQFCTSLTLKFKLKGRFLEMIWKMLQNDMHEVENWIFLNCSLLYLAHTRKSLKWVRTNVF